MAKRKRYRSNFFHPKVKRPLSFELTKRGHTTLAAVMNRCEVSLGDVVEHLLRTYGTEVQPACFPRPEKKTDAAAA